MQKRRSGWILLVCAVAVILFGGPLASHLLDRLFLPWAFANDEHPALVGSWVGSATTATGRSQGVLPALQLPEPANSRIARPQGLESPSGAPRVQDTRDRVTIRETTP